MRIKFHDEAFDEFWQIIEYYDDKSIGLGENFADNVYASFDQVKHMPELWVLRDDGTRRYLMHRFPYIIVYLLLGETIWIVAIAHCKRKSGYWEKRIRNIKS